MGRTDLDRLARESHWDCPLYCSWYESSDESTGRRSSFPYLFTHSLEPVVPSRIIDSLHSEWCLEGKVLTRSLKGAERNDLWSLISALTLSETRATLSLTWKKTSSNLLRLLSGRLCSTLTSYKDQRSIFLPSLSSSPKSSGNSSQPFHLHRIERWLIQWRHQRE